MNLALTECWKRYPTISQVDPLLYISWSILTNAQLDEGHIANLMSILLKLKMRVSKVIYSSHLFMIFFLLCNTLLFFKVRYITENGLKISYRNAYTYLFKKAKYSLCSVIGLHQMTPSPKISSRQNHKTQWKHLNLSLI